MANPPEIPKECRHCMQLTGEGCIMQKYPDPTCNDNCSQYCSTSSLTAAGPSKTVSPAGAIESNDTSTYGTMNTDSPSTTTQPGQQGSPDGWTTSTVSEMNPNTSDTTWTPLSTGSPAFSEPSGPPQSGVTDIGLSSTSSGLPSDSSSEAPPIVQPTAITSSAISASSSNHAGAIAGGVIGGLAFLCLLTLLIFFRAPLFKRWRKWRMRNRVAPSSEFKNHPALLSASPGYSVEPGLGAGVGRRYSTPLLSLRTASPMYAVADEEQPPPFTPGGYSDPVLEKVSAAQQQREMMFDPYRDYANGSAAGQVVGSSMGHGAERGYS